MHLGNEGACQPYTYADVIGQTHGIDAVLDGHSHDTEKVVMKNEEGAEVAVANGGNIRVDIPKGEVTVSDLLTTYPFGNKVMTAEVTGQQILDALEWGARVVPEENGAFLQVSGMTYEIDTSIQSSCVRDANGMFAGVTGEYRVKNVTVNGEPLDLERTYTLAAQSYVLADQGDGQTAFDGAKILWESDKLDYEYLKEYIQSLPDGAIGDGYENPYGQERIVAVE